MIDLKNLFWDPDSFPGDPYGFAVNQTAHFAVVGFLPVWWGVPAWVADLLVELGSLVGVTLPDMTGERFFLILALFAAWEFGQVRLAGGEVWDSFEDFGFVAAGALTALWWPVAGLALVFLAAGAARRAGI